MRVRMSYIPPNHPTLHATRKKKRHECNALVPKNASKGQSTQEQSYLYPPPLNNLPTNQLQLATLSRPPPLQHPPPLTRFIMLPHIRHAISRTPLATMPSIPSTPPTTIRRNRTRVTNRTKPHTLSARLTSRRNRGRGRRRQRSID